MSQTLARKTLSVVAVVAAIGLLAGIVTPTPAQATSFSCQQAGSCPNQASCEGSHYVRDGCTIQCLVPAEGSSTELVNAGSATCGSAGGGGGDSGGGGDWWCGTYCW